VTFTEIPAGETSGNVVRQYWSREGGTWKIFYEGFLL
jgi:hypothetical protein